MARTRKKSKVSPKAVGIAALVLVVLGVIGGAGKDKEPAPTPTEAPTAAAVRTVTTPEPPSSPEPTATPYRIHGVDPAREVYVSRQGVIHFKSTCSGMKYYDTMTMEQADAAGYTEVCDHCR